MAEKKSWDKSFDAASGNTSRISKMLQKKQAET
jgi:hypothetical protein